MNTDHTAPPRPRTLLPLLLAVACTACSAPVPPASEPAAAANTPVSTTTTPDLPAPESTASDAPASGARPAPDTTTGQAELPEVPVRPASATAPSTATPSVEVARAPLPKPKPTLLGKPARPMPAHPLPASAGQAAPPMRITINALSRGNGVPAATREAFKQIRGLLESQQASTAVTSMQQQRIGIEGESRLCVEFRTASAAQSALAEIRRIAAGAELIDVVEAPCPSNKE